MPPRPLAQLLPLQQRVGVQRDRRNRVVDIVGDATGDLTQRALALLLQDRLL